MCSAPAHVRFVPIADIPVRLFDQFAGASNQVEWHGDPERRRGFEVDQQVDFGGSVDWQVSRFLAF